MARIYVPSSSRRSASPKQLDRIFSQAFEPTSAPAYVDIPLRYRRVIKDSQGVMRMVL